MTTRCETCPLQNFCTEIIETDTAQIASRQQLLAELRLRLVDIDFLDMEADALGEAYLDELEHESADGSEDIGHTMEEYLRLTDRGNQIRQHAEALRKHARELMTACLYTLENSEQRLALGKQLQGIMADGCEQGPSGLNCNAPGTDQLLTELGNIVLPLPHTNEAA